MSLTFGIGQRVRIEFKRSPHHGKAGKIISIEPGDWDDGTLALGVAPDDTCYCLELDGIGRYNMSGHQIAAPSWALRPLTPPEQKTTWDQCPWAPDKIREQVRA